VIERALPAKRVGRVICGKPWDVPWDVPWEGEAWLDLGGFGSAIGSAVEGGMGGSV